MGSAGGFRRSLGRFGAKLAIAEEYRGLVEEISDENVGFSRIDEETAGSVEERWAIVEESGDPVDEIDLKNEEIAGSVGGNGRPTKETGVPLRKIKAPLKEIFSALEKWKAP